MKRRLLTILLIIIAVAAISFAVFTLIPKNGSNNTSPETTTPSLSINGRVIYLEIADTEQKRTEGLSGRDSLPQNSGMLFVFDTPGQYEFWMNEMRFPLDFIWLNENKVVQTDENIPAPPKDALPAFIRPEYAVDKVLEVNAGFIKSASIKIGDEVKISF